jgi:hypothetical protein
LAQAADEAIKALHPDIESYPGCVANHGFSGPMPIAPQLWQFGLSWRGARRRPGVTRPCSAGSCNCDSSALRTAALRGVC